MIGHPMAGDFVFDPRFDLRLEKIVDVAPNVIWKAWTTPEILVKWFCPRPWLTLECEIDLRPGGMFRTVMQSPEGQRFPNLGCYLETITNRRLAWTNAMLPGYRPNVVGDSSTGFLFTAIVSMEPHNHGTKYVAVAKHKDETDCKKHSDMGFEQGWSICLDQLLEVVRSNNVK
jgi:uncharacterized protein YndB with AHSA1/START domain